VVPDSVVMLGHCCDSLGLIFGLGLGAWPELTGWSSRARRRSCRRHSPSLVVMTPAPAAGRLQRTLRNRAPRTRSVQINRICMQRPDNSCPAHFPPSSGSARDYQELPATSNPNTAEQAGGQDVCLCTATAGPACAHAAGA
jgi:hypothetical protein